MGLEESIDYEPAWRRYRKHRRLASVGTTVGGLAVILTSQVDWHPSIGPRAIVGTALAVVMLTGVLVFRLDSFHCPQCGKLFRGIGGLHSFANLRRSKCGYCGIGVGENPSKLA